MNFLAILKDSVKTCSRIIKYGANIQAEARHRLIKDLQNVCSKVETAYSTVLASLQPVKDSYQDPSSLAKELRRFAADKKTRKAFKPDHLCGEVDSLLSDLESNLDALKYSIDMNKIKTIRGDIQRVGNLDMEMFEAYDRFTKDLDALSTEIQTATDIDLSKRVTYVQHVITDFENDLFEAIKEMREAKDLILR